MSNDSNDICAICHDNLGEDVYMPSPVKVFELQNYLDLKDV